MLLSHRLCFLTQCFLVSLFSLPCLCPKFWIRFFDWSAIDGHSNSFSSWPRFVWQVVHQFESSPQQLKGAMYCRSSETTVEGIRKKRGASRENEGFLVLEKVDCRCFERRFDSSGKHNLLVWIHSLQMKYPSKRRSGVSNKIMESVFSPQTFLRNNEWFGNLSLPTVGAKKGSMA